MNSIEDILFAKPADWRRLDVTLVQLQGQCIGWNDRAFVPGDAVIVRHGEFRTVCLDLVVESESVEVDLLNIDRNLSSVVSSLTLIQLSLV